MTGLHISISDDCLQRLQALADKTGVPLTDLACYGLEEWLTARNPDFEKIAKYVMTKNAELYRRLAAND